MADQVNPTGSLAPGISIALSIASATRAAPENSSAVKPADIPARGTDASPVLASANSPQAAMEQVNSHLEQAGSKLKFEVDSATGRTVYKVLEPGSGQVLLQVPSDEMLALARNVRVMQQKMTDAGVLVDKQG